ncbi:MAG: winged helix-turn-helix domain-containing protein [Candidatus Bathyarchaeia archaeon]|jgi:predicted transcriptional regulator
MAKHRDRIGIIADVLKAAGKGARKTRIMCTANLGFGLLKKYLDEAVALGYLTLSQEEYGVTEDGDVFLKKYVAYVNRYSGVVRELQSLRLEKEELTRMCMNGRKCGFKSSANKGQLVQAPGIGSESC